MRALGGGRLVQISSGAGQAGFAGLSIYCATKWGIEGFFESLAPEVVAFGIQTTLVEPGTIGRGLANPAFSARSWKPIAKGPVGILAEDGFRRIHRTRRSGKDGESDRGHIRS